MGQNWDSGYRLCIVLRKLLLVYNVRYNNINDTLTLSVRYYAPDSKDEQNFQIVQNGSNDLEPVFIGMVNLRSAR